MEKFKIIVDSRESVGTGKGHKGGRRIYENLLKFNNIEVEIQDLGDCVDYMIPAVKETQIFQRKRAAEIINHKAVFEDAVGMKELEKEKGFKPWFIIENTLSVIQRFSGWKEESVIGIVDSILEDFRIPIIPSSNIYYTTKWLVARAKRLGRTEEKPYVPMRPGAPRKAPVKQQVLYVLESFPLIGPKLAESVMCHYGNLYNFVLNAEHIDEVEDVGPKIKEIVLKILHHKWETS